MKKDKLIVFGIAFIIGCAILFLLGKTISMIRLIFLIGGICLGMYIWDNFVKGSSD